MNTRPLTSPLWFAAPLVAAYATAFFVVGSLPRAEAPGAVAAGLTLDLVVLVPALYYAVLVRGRRWPAITVAPVVLLSFGAASALVPAEHGGLLRAMGHALPAVELALVGYGGYRAYRAVRAGRAAHPAGGDFHDRARAVLRDAFGSAAVAGVLAYEAALVHYAFAMRPAAPPAHGFSYHRRSGYGAVFAAILMAAALELAAVHVLLRAWSEAAALVHLVLSAYGVLWLTGDYRAMRRRPHELRDDGLRVRFGLRWSLDAPWDGVLAVRRTRRAASEDGYLNTAPAGSPRYVVELRTPATATGPYGLTRAVRRVGLIVDEPRAFEARLLELGVRVDA